MYTKASERKVYICKIQYMTRKYKKLRSDLNRNYNKSIKQIY
ncbi:hypothetical protein CLOBAR_00811 [Intestinibacter bartlettii DSM 16795]|nr:hypothetical protein CLOBAR_00811 [Intestinibacter bartlettii DSM 16795]